MYETGVSLLRDVDMNAVSVAQMWPCMSGVQKVLGSSPRTAR